MHALRVTTIAAVALAVAATWDNCAAADVSARVQALELLVSGDGKPVGPNDTATVQLEHSGLYAVGLTLMSREREAASSLARLKKDAQDLDAKLDAFHKATQGDAYNSAIGADNQHGLGADCRNAKALTGQLEQLASNAQRIASQHIAAINSIPIGQGDSIARLTEETTAIEKASKDLFMTQNTQELADNVKRLAQGFRVHEKEGAFVTGAAEAAVRAARELRTEAFVLQKLNIEIAPLVRAYIPARAEAMTELADLKPLLMMPSEGYTLSKLESTLNSSYVPPAQLPSDAKQSEAAVETSIKKGDDAIADIEKKRAPIDRELASCGEPLLAEKFDDDRTKAGNAILEAQRNLDDAYIERASQIEVAEKKAQSVIEMETATLAIINPKIEKLKAMYDATPKSNTDRRQKILAKIRELQEVGRQSTNNILKMQLARPTLTKEQVATKQQQSRAGGALGAGLTIAH